MPQKLILFGTSACHLCEQAEDLLSASGYKLNKVDITEDPHLLNKYGVFIPVLTIEGVSEALYWPFDKEKISEFLQQYKYKKYNDIN